MPKTKTKTSRTLQFETAKLAQFAEAVSTTRQILSAFKDLVPTLTPDGLGEAYTILKRLETTLTHDRSGDGILDEVKAALLSTTLAKGDPEGVVLTPHYRIKRTETTRKTIVAAELLSRGVTPTIIQESTKVSESVYARVTPRKNPGAES